MPYPNFTVEDLSHMMVAFAALPLFVLVPGYVIGWLGNVLSFRGRTVIMRLMLSLTLSVAICPAITYIIARFLPFDAVWLFYGPIWLIFLALMVQPLRIGIARWHLWKDWLTHRYTLTVIVISMVVWLVGAGSLVDLQLEHKLYFNTVAFDYQWRISLTDAIARTGIPPAHPFFYPGHPVPVAYHDYWFLICSLPVRLGLPLVNARGSLMAGTLWVGFALLATIGLYLRLHTPLAAKYICRRALLGAALVVVMGLDIIPMVVYFLNSTHYSNRASIVDERWNGNNFIMSWIDTTLWDPNEMLSALTCITAFLLIQEVRSGNASTRNLFAMGISGIGLASAFGSSVYVGMVFAIFWIVWIVANLPHPDQRFRVPYLILAGVVALGFALPFTFDTLRASGTQTAIPFAMEVRGFGPLENLPLSDQVRPLINLMVLPINYLLSLGFLAIAGMIYFSVRRRTFWTDAHDRPALLMLLTSVLICSFVRSTVVGSNDLGWRGFLIAQFILLIWSVEVIIGLYPRIFNGRQALIELQPTRTVRWVSGMILGLGVLGTAYNLISLRMNYVWSDAGLIWPLYTPDPDQQLGPRTYALRQAYEFTNIKLPRSAILQNNPDSANPDQSISLYSFHQRLAVAPSGGMPSFGVPEAEVLSLTSPIAQLFSDVDGASTVNLSQICQTFKMDALIIRDIDPVWKNRNGWVWQTPAAFSNDYVRVLLCHPSNVQLPESGGEQF